MKQPIIVGGIIVGVIAIVFFVFFGIGIGSFFDDKRDPQDVLEDQLQEEKEEVATLKYEKDKLIAENRRLEAEVERLNSSRPGGGAVEEKRKALVEKEAALDAKEKQFSQREETIRLAENKVRKREQEFYERTGLKLEEIGEAKQIRKEYKNIQAARERAEERANNWLIYFSVLLVVFVAGVLFLVGFLAYMAAKSKRTDAAVRIIDSINMSSQDRRLLLASLGGRQIDQSTDEDDES